MSRTLKEYCGVFGIAGYPEAAKITYLGLYALQHRGQESAGIVTNDGEQLCSHTAMGLVSEIYDERTLNSLPGTIAIGHVRYSTTGSSNLRNAQPICVTTHRGELALAHNGNLVNAEKLRNKLENINETLQKIEQGKYGICERCGKKITWLLLRIEPTSRLCRKCKKSIKK